MDKKEYGALTDRVSKNSRLVKDCVCAFLVGGGICLIGQGLKDIYVAAAIPEKDAYTLVSVSLIFISALLTGFGVYDRLARLGGAGTLVPITGFANAVVSPAMEFKAEGLVLGLAPKMFTVAGPVIVYGTVASAVFGLIYWVWEVVFA